MADDATQPRALLAAALAFVAMTSLAACGSADEGPTRRHPGTTAVSSAPSVHTRAPVSTTPPPPPTSSSAPDPAVAARATLRRLVHKRPDGMVSVAALDTSTGARFAAGARKGMWMASTYKLLVLENLLAVQQDDGGLSAGELATAQSAIENSDNVAGYQLYLDAGGISALTALTNRLHMRHTVPWAADPTFTSTSAPDCLKLLHALVRPNATLNANSREQALGLMRNVEADQRWGVGVDADRGTSFANKNGWLAVDNSNGYGHDDDDRWIVTSLGVVTVRGHQLLLAALTQHNESMATGVALVQRLARLVATAVGDQPHAAG